MERMKLWGGQLQADWDLSVAEETESTKVCVCVCVIGMMLDVVVWCKIHLQHASPFLQVDVHRHRGTAIEHQTYCSTECADP